MFLKRLQLFFNFFVREKNHISLQREYSIPLKQLLVKEILVNGPWRLDFLGPTALVIAKLAKYLTISVFSIIP